MSKPASQRERIFTGIATVVILAIAFWLFVGRSPGGTKREEVAFGDSVETDAGTVAVLSLDEVTERTEGAPAPTAGNEVRAIRFRSCRNADEGQVVDMSLFFVELPGDVPDAPAAGSALIDSAGACVGGRVFVQLPLGVSPVDVVYAADPMAVWVIPAS